MSTSGINIIFISIQLIILLSFGSKVIGLDRILSLRFPSLSKVLINKRLIDHHIPYALKEDQ